MSGDNRFRDLPSVDEVATGLESALPWPLLVDVARTALDQARRDIASGASADPVRQAQVLAETLERSSGVAVINATGVLLHTNLGRARWSEEAVRRAATAASQSINLELSLTSGERSSRGGYATTLIRRLTGAEDALVVNNNAGAVLLALAATAGGRAVPVSRGELIEIGGAYRLPDVMRASGARLVEVGTTNRTRVGDYETALQTYDCGAILKVHPSNYQVEGFTSEAGIGELAGLATKAGVPLIHDIGSGLLDSTTPWLDGPPPHWLNAEPGARQSIESGADLVTFSGDKLLGGPQAGIVVGSAEAVARLRAHPLARALRVDGPTLAALAATLESYSLGTVVDIPFWRQALTTPDQIRARAGAIQARVGGTVADGDSAVGAGSAPGAAIPSAHLVLPAEDHLYEPLLGGETPIVTRRESGALIVDLRTVDPSDDEAVASSILKCR